MVEFDSIGLDWIDTAESRVPAERLTIHLLDLLREHRADVASLHLQSGRQFARAHREVAFQDRELLNPTHYHLCPTPYFCALLNAPVLYC